MFSPCLSAGDLRFWDVPVPLGSSASLTVRLLACRADARSSDQTPSGFPRSARLRYDRGGCPLLRRDHGVHIRRGATRRTERSNLPVGANHRSGYCANDDALSRGFTSVHPSGLSLARFGRMVRPLLRLPPALWHLTVTSDALREREQALDTGLAIAFLYRTHSVRPRVALPHSLSLALLQNCRVGCHPYRHGIHWAAGGACKRLNGDAVRCITTRLSAISLRAKIESFHPREGVA